MAYLRTGVVALGIMFLCVAHEAHAARRSFTVQPGQVFSASAGGRTYLCAPIRGGYHPGTFARDSTTDFVPYQLRLRSLRQKLTAASGAQKARLQRRVRSGQSFVKTGKEACADGPSSFFPGPVPTPGTSPQPNFDSSGNVTSAGKTLFGIPQRLAANISQGKIVFESNCVGCHEPRVNRSFGNLRSNISRPPMFFDEVRMPDESLAHLTAYLNRFRP